MCFGSGLAGLGSAVVLASLAFGGCLAPPHDDAGPEAETASEASSDPDPSNSDPDRRFARAFVEQASDLGVDFRHESGARGELWMPETLGSGVGLIDYDGDGDLDLYLVQGGWLDERPDRHAEQAPMDRLFHNDLAETGSLGFRDVTEATGLFYRRAPGRGYGQGVAVGDFDRDGDEDLFVTAFGADRLLRNDGGVFSAVEGPWSDAGWSTSALFVDLRGDSPDVRRPELFVARYLDYSLGTHKDCYFTTGAADYCKPLSYGPLSDRLYEQTAGGSWRDVSAAAGLSATRGNGLGVVAADFDGDGRREIFVANDQMANHLWLVPNDHEPYPLREDGSLAGVALNAEGVAEASMGVVAADFDRDGELDLLMTHLEGESHTLYRGLGGGLFDDASHRANLSAATLGATGFGVAALDFDGDGWVDLAVANGKVHLDPTREPDPTRPLPLEEADQLLRNESGKFRSIPGEAFETPAVGRGVAVGDLDNDGDADLVFNDSEGPARVLVNTLGQDALWIGLALEDSAGLDPGEGVPVTVRLADEAARATSRLRLRQRGGSYLSSNDSRVLFGLGDCGSCGEGVWVTVRWQHGEAETFGPLATSRYHRLRQGEGASP